MQGRIMHGMKRYAIYHVPPPGAWADWGAAWLGWDVARGRAVAHPDCAGLHLPLPDLTEAPRRYGFHATLKAPFRLAGGTTPQALHEACTALAAATAPVVLDGLRLSRQGGFLALVPEGGPEAASDLAARWVAGLDGFRAPATAAEIARRNPDRLTAHQRRLLERWGYPWVMDQFRFHMTLTGPLSPEQASVVSAALAPVLAPLIPRPMVIGDVCLCGEDAGGYFRILHRYALMG